MLTGLCAQSGLTAKAYSQARHTAAAPTWTKTDCRWRVLTPTPNNFRTVDVVWRLSVLSRLRKLGCRWLGWTPIRTAISMEFLFGLKMPIQANTTWPCILLIVWLSCLLSSWIAGDDLPLDRSRFFWIAPLARTLGHYPAPVPVDAPGGMCNYSLW